MKHCDSFALEKSLIGLRSLFRDESDDPLLGSTVGIRRYYH